MDMTSDGIYTAFSGNNVGGVTIYKYDKGTWTLETKIIGTSFDAVAITNNFLVVGII